MTKKELEEIRDEIFSKIWHYYQNIVRARIGPNEPEENAVWIIANVVDLTIRELKTKRMLKNHDHK